MRRCAPHTLLVSLELIWGAGLSTPGWNTQITSRMAFRSNGTISCSNHGFRFAQIALRQLGCGNGRKAGPYSANALTVSVRDIFSF
jgi:hypothetical protein